MEMERGTSPTMTGFSLVVNTETQAQASSVISGAAQCDQEAKEVQRGKSPSCGHTDGNLLVSSAHSHCHTASVSCSGLQ